MRYWILKDRKPFKVKDRNVFYTWSLSSLTIVNFSTTSCGKNITTKFLGKSQKKGDPPALFFTEIEGPEDYFKKKYYQTWDDAVEGHSKILNQIAEANSN